MKKFLILFAALFIGIVAAHADTKTMNWIVDGSTYDTTTCTVGGDLVPPTAPTRYGYTFQGWRPYIPIEYIKSTGTQYIDTGIALTHVNTRVVMKYLMPSNVTGALFGSRINDQRNFANWYTNVYIMHGCSVTDGYALKLANGNYFDVILIMDRLYNGATNIYDELGLRVAGGPSWGGTIPDPPLMINIIFPGSNGGTSVASIPSSIQIYNFKMYEDDVLVRDFIPVLDPDNVACMYDLVTNTFFYNAGTGDFVAGPVIGD